MAEYLTVADVARRLRLHEMTVRRHISEGRLRAIRVGRSIRVKEEDLERFLEPMEEPSAAELLPTPADQELERRRGVVRRILENRERRVISPLTTAQLAREARAEVEDIREGR